MTEFGSNVRTVRLIGKFTLQELARRAGISYVYLHQLETGKATNISLRVAMRIAEALRVPLQDLLAKRGRS